MATKEDILEQIVEEFLIHRGYFVQHNIKFRPRADHGDFILNQDSNHSDIDVLGFHPLLSGPDKVIAVSCKSWQGGFHPASEIAAIEGDKRLRGRHAWQAFRELCRPKWSEAFCGAVRAATGQDTFTHVTAVARLRGDAAIWHDHPPFRAALGGNPLRIWTFAAMVAEIGQGLTTTLAASEVGRMLQLFKVAGLLTQQPATPPLLTGRILKDPSRPARSRPARMQVRTRSEGRVRLVAGSPPGLLRTAGRDCLTHRHQNLKGRLPR